MKKTTSPFIIIKDSSIHCKGIFAKKNISKGTQIIEYVGEKITKKEADRRGEIVLQLSKDHLVQGGVYIFEINKRYDIDGNVSWNTARYINHCCEPNCETENIKGHIWIISTKDIKQGEELFYNYGYEFDEYYHEHPCKCQSKRCVGYILKEEAWPKLKRTLKKKTK
jgi:uncharacterized protein